MLGKFFKPKWQHNDPKVRLQGLDALASDSVELINLAQADPDSEVRMAAITRLSHLPTLIQLGHAPGSLGERARQRVNVLAASDVHHDALLADVFHWLTNPSLLRSIARDASRATKLRQHAIASLKEQELLFQIASTDPSKEIQYWAAKQLHDLALLEQLDKTRGKNNKRLRQLIKERLTHAQQQAQQRQAVDALCTEAESLGSQGTWAQEKTRRLVLEQRWQKLAATADLGQQQRFQAAIADFLARLDAHTQQEQATRPMREARQHLLHSAEALLHQLQEHPTSLSPTELDGRIHALQQAWESQPTLPAEEQIKVDQQWQGLQGSIKHLRDSLVDDLRTLAALQELAAQAATLHQQAATLHHKDILTLQNAWANARRPKQLRSHLNELEQQFQRHLAALHNRHAKQQQHQANQLAALQQQLQQLEATLENEQYGEALELHQALATALKEAGQHTKEHASLQRRVQQLTPFIRELQDWKRWGTDQARQHLIETAEHMREDAILDPVERAKKIKQLRTEWRKLAHIDPGRQQSQWKSFDSAVSAAYEPSKHYFAEQAKQRAAHLAQREALCAQLEDLHTQTDWSNVSDWRAIQKQVEHIRQQWKTAGTVSHQEWQGINSRFNAAMDALDAHFKAERERNWQARLQLVAQAEALLELPDTRQAMAQAKALQSQWHITLSSRPGEEQRLWKQFRTPIDAIFSRAREEREQQRQQQEEAKATAERQAQEERQRALAQQQQLWASLDALAAQSEQDKRADTPAATQDANRLQGEKLCLQLEILLELPSPPECQQARLQYQVAQLPEAMRSRKQARDRTSQAIALLQQWYALGGMPEAAHSSQQARIAAVRQALQATQLPH